MADYKSDPEPIPLSSFQKFKEANLILKNLLSISLAVDPAPEENRNEENWLNALTKILDEYQEQANLLDPYLERLVVPVAHTLRDHVLQVTSGDARSFSMVRVNRLAWAMYIFIKVRGYKTIVRFFPHDVSDLPMVIKYVTQAEPVKEAYSWTLRYIMMLWLSLVCMLPFDLAQFDEGYSTVSCLENIGTSELRKSGLERDGAALLLSKLYMRKDTTALLASFLESIQTALQGSPNVLEIIGSLRVLADVGKSAPLELLRPHITRIQDLISEMACVESLSPNTVVRKLRAKCISRIAVRLLPTRPRRIRLIAKHLDSRATKDDKPDADEEVEEPDVPGEVEHALGELFELMQDKDTSVRWSSAKGIANISERLPASFIDQIMDNIFGIYAVYGLDIAPSELPSTAEHSWHGATLACAEMARRNLISGSKLPDVLLWARKALVFDVQKGSFSIGSNVRDSAAYVLWSLARTRNHQSLEQYAIDLARDLVTVALFDREVHVRRAASATFQENVGRMNLFPHGIPILSLIDFFSVGIRRHSFVDTAPKVYRYTEYQEAILQHLLRTTLKHWDEAMRRLGAQALKAVCETDIQHNIPRVVDALKTLLLSVDPKDVHGALLALSELAGAISNSDAQGFMQHDKKKIFRLIDSVPSTMVLSPRNHLITEAACYLIANSMSAKDSDNLHDLSTEPFWRTIIFHGLKSRNDCVQEAAAAAMGSLSRLKDCSEDCKRLIKEFKRSSGIIQQSLTRVLGVFDYVSHRNGIDVAMPCLLDVVDPKSPGYFRDVEARRNAYTSMAAIVDRVAERLDDYISSDTMNNIWKAFFVGVEDYTVNERGDVGSWVRLSCIQGLCCMLEALVNSTRSSKKQPSRAWVESSVTFSKYLPLDVYHKAIGMILKQGVERLDNVRQCVGRFFPRLLTLDPPSFERGEDWSVRGRDFFSNLLVDSGSPGWNDGAWLYPKAVRFLEIRKYRDPILRGLLLSVGSRTSSTQQLASMAMLGYARDLPFGSKRVNPSTTVDNEMNDIYTLISDILAIAHENPKFNNTVIPALHLFNVMLEGDVFSTPLDQVGEPFLDLLTEILELASRNVERLQSMQRIDESMRIVVNMLGLGSSILRKRAIAKLERFLLHPFPKVRTDTAEAIYVALQTKDIEFEAEAEQILLETECGRAAARTCTVSPLGEGKDDTAQILDAIQDCGKNGRIILAHGSFNITKKMTWELENSRVDLYGVLNVNIDSAVLCSNTTDLQDSQFVPDIDYWLDESNTYRVVFIQSQSSWFVVTGRDFEVDAHNQGGINGNGQPWWEYFQNHTREDGDGRPLSLTLHEVQRGVIKNFRIQSPPFWCNAVSNSRNVIYDGMTCNATNSNPAYFGQNIVPNTDGIDTYRSDHVTLKNWDVTCGDDCLAIKGNSTNIVAQGITCRGGNGIAFGSLGQYVQFNDIVQNVLLEDLTFIRLNSSIQPNMRWGVYFKSWSGTVNGEPPTGGGGGGGFVNNILARRATLDGVDTPVALYQTNGAHSGDTPSFLQFGDLSFEDWSGNATSNTLVDIDCSSNAPCPNITFEKFDVLPPDGTSPSFVCINVESENGLPGSCNATGNP
ncbi:hypothetical protein ACEPAG_1769 [Sanghuangporus baumii]